MARIKTFVVPVFVKFGRDSYNNETDYTEQSLAIMDVPGFSHFRYGSVKKDSHVNWYGWSQLAVFRCTNRERLRAEIKKALGANYWQGFHSVNYDDPT